MTIETPTLYIIFSVLALIVFLSCLMKKAKPATILFFTGSIIVSMLFLARLFPLNFPASDAGGLLKSWCPLKNIISSNQIYIDPGDGVPVKMTGLFDQLIVGCVLDMALSVVLSAGAVYCLEKTGKVLWGIIPAFALVLVKIILSFCNITNSQFDSIELVIAIAGAALGFGCGALMLKQKKSKNG